MTRKYIQWPSDTIIEAVQFTDKNKEQVLHWAQSIQANVFHSWNDDNIPCLMIPWLPKPPVSSDMPIEIRCDIGDWIIIDPEPYEWCRLYTCSDEDFQKEYTQSNLMFLPIVEILSQSEYPEVEISRTIATLKNEGKIKENEVSDGYHTFNELYEFRKMYNAALFNAWAELDRYDVHKSRLHNDGLHPFGKDNWFIVVAILPAGQISNHYKIEDWDLFDIPAVQKAKYPFDGHTSQDVIERLKALING